MNHDFILIGAPVDSGASQPGCLMGPDAFRTAGLIETLSNLGGTVQDRGNITPQNQSKRSHSNPALHHLAETISWTEALSQAAQTACNDGFPIFMGGDHSLSLGSVKGVAEYAASQNRPLFVLWLDAHPDFHTPHTTQSGNLHGTPLAYVTGQNGFEGFPEITQPVDPKNICIFGARSVDPAELRL